MELFKGDAIEQKVMNAGLSAFSSIDAAKQSFYADGFKCATLARLLYDENRAPLTTSIPYENFKDVFNIIFDLFPVTGTFEVYIAVFNAIFGDDVEISFTVPDPGKLAIAIVATGLESSYFSAREIVENEYESNRVTDDQGNKLYFVGIKGLTSEYAVTTMLYEMVTGGVYVTVSLTLGV
jgi:hypothetical protein